MKKTLRICAYWVLCWSAVGHATVGFDNPVFYRAPMLQGIPPYKISSWMTSVVVKGARGTTWSSRDSKGNKRSLLSVYGPMDLVPMGMNIEGAGEQTLHYWNRGL